MKDLTLISVLRYQMLFSSIFMVFPIKRTENNLSKSNYLTAYTFLLLCFYCFTSAVVFFNMLYNSVFRNVLVFNGYVSYISQIVDFITGRIATLTIVIQAVRKSSLTINFYENVKKIDDQFNTLNVIVKKQIFFWRTQTIIVIIVLYFTIITFTNIIRVNNLHTFSIGLNLILNTPILIEKIGNSLVVLAYVNYALVIKSQFKTLNKYLDDVHLANVSSRAPVFILGFSNILETMAVYNDIFGTVILAQMAQNLISGTSAIYIMCTVLINGYSESEIMIGVIFWIIHSISKNVLTVWFLNSAIFEVPNGFFFCNIN